MFKVPNRQDPYSAIGKYIRDHITVIEDIIAVIRINDIETNQLFTVDTSEENYFIWETDWWEGEEDVTLIDFFPVSEAQRANQSVQSADTISRQQAIEAVENIDCSDGVGISALKCEAVDDVITAIKALPSAQPEKTQHSEEDTTSDCISRQAAIEYFMTNTNWYDEDGGMIEDAEDKRKLLENYFNALPSAQPDLFNNNILRHPQCTSRTKLGNCNPIGGFCTSVPKEMCDAQEHEKYIDADLINRKTLIHELNNSHYPGAPYVDAGISIAIGKVCDAPNVKSEIVRCKDCMHWKQQTNYAGIGLSFGFCESDDMWRSLYGETYEVAHIDTDEDFYCGYAERKTNE